MTLAEAWITGEYPNQKLNLKLPTGADGPATQLSIGDTTTGPDVTGVKGDKGDPGGIVMPIELTVETNLNDILTPGLYSDSTLADITTARNFPVAGLPGTLVVTRETGLRITQTYYPISTATSGRLFYQRVNSTSWGPWRTFASTRVDQTAGRTIYQWDDVNNREQLIYGDTGWRDITSLGVTTAGIHSVRRVGSTVTMQWNAWKASTGSSLGTLPVGFNPNIANYQPIIHPISRGVRAFLINPNGTNAIVNAAVDEVFNTSATWQTVEPWPTTLPGVALGSIPNL